MGNLSDDHGNEQRERWLTTIAVFASTGLDLPGREPGRIVRTGVVYDLWPTWHPPFILGSY